MIDVSAGVIRRSDGCILLCKRGEGRRNAHLWEFPGGKREPGEDAAAALRRELMEELFLPVTDVAPLCIREAEGIRFTFLSAATCAEPRLTEHEDAVFVHPRALLNYAFCPADEPVARSLALNAPPLRHFFWDFDGTLMDTYPLMTRLVIESAADQGVALDPARCLDLMKVNLGHCYRTLSAETGVPVEAFREGYDRRSREADLSRFMMIEGIPETLERLSALGGRHYLATHRDTGALRALEMKGMLRYFDGWVTSEDHFPNKPAPDMLLHLLDRFSIDPAQAVMIGDRPLDTASGRAAGMLSCLLDVEGRFPDDPCELRTARAIDLAALLCPAPVDN